MCVWCVVCLCVNSFFSSLAAIVTMLLGFQQVEGGPSLWIASGSLVLLCVLVLHTFVRRKRTVVDTYAALASEIELEMDSIRI